MYSLLYMSYIQNELTKPVKSQHGKEGVSLTGVALRIFALGTIYIHTLLFSPILIFRRETNNFQGRFRMIISLSFPLDNPRFYSVRVPLTLSPNNSLSFIVWTNITFQQFWKWWLLKIGLVFTLSSKGG